MNLRNKENKDNFSTSNKENISPRACPHEPHIMTHYNYISERYLEGTKRFHDVTNYFVITESLLFSLFVGGYRDISPFIKILFPLAGMTISIIWFLILFRIEHMRNMRKFQGKVLEEDMEKNHDIHFYVFRKEEYDVAYMPKSPWLVQLIQNFQVSHLAYMLPGSFTMVWLAILIEAINLEPIFIHEIKSLFESIIRN